jgi:hypothetical protein
VLLDYLPVRLAIVLRQWGATNVVVHLALAL